MKEEIAAAFEGIKVGGGSLSRVLRGWCAGELYRPRCSLGRSRLTRNGGQGNSIALTIRSLDPTLQMYKVEPRDWIKTGSVRKPINNYMVLL